MKILPQAKDVEEVVLGTVMIDKNAVIVARSEIKSSEYFYDNRHGMIWDAIISLDNKNAPIDLLTVTEELKKSGNLKKVGGAYFLSGLTGRVGSASNLEYHARIIVQKWMMRKMIENGSWLLEKCYDGSDDVFDIINEFDLKMGGVSGVNKDRSKKLHEITDEVIKDAQVKHDRGEDIVGINLTGEDEFERIHGGGEEGDFIMIGGDSGSGKSSFFNTIAAKAVLDDRPMFMWSGELSDKRMAARILAAFSGISSQKIRGGDFFSNKDMEHNLDLAVRKLKEERNIFLKFGAMSLSELKRTLIHYNRFHGIKLFLLDRLELFELNQINKDQEKAKEVFLQMLRTMATEIKACILLAGQFAKSRLDKQRMKRPDMYCFLGASAIYQSATKIFLLYRPEYYGYSTFLDSDESSAGKAEIIIAKNTDGAAGKSIIMPFHPEQTVFGNGFIIGDKIHADGFWPDAEMPAIPEKVTVDKTANTDEDIPF